jgi:hypothetical protein
MVESILVDVISTYHCLVALAEKTSCHGDTVAALNFEF